MNKCGCKAYPVNNSTVIEYCPLHAAAPDLLKALTVGIGIVQDADFTTDLESIAALLEDTWPGYAEAVSAKAQAIRVALAGAKGGGQP